MSDRVEQIARGTFTARPATADDVGSVEAVGPNGLTAREEAARRLDAHVPAGPACHTIGQTPPAAALPPLGARVVTITDYADRNRPNPEPRRGQVVGYANVHHRPGDTDDPRPVVTLAVVALDLNDQGWVTRSHTWHDTGHLDGSCYVSMILADPDSLRPDPERPADPAERRSERYRWGADNRSADGPTA